jgi:dihydrofolate reductase
MRRVIVSEFVSVDCVVQAPGGGEPDFKHESWTFDIEPDPVMYEYKLHELLECDALLLGRRTYDGFAASWPDRNDDAGFADRINSMSKYVASTTLRDPKWQFSSVLTGDVAEAVDKLKQQDGGPILVYGSPTLVSTLYENDLVDEYRLMVFPVVLGSGKRLFPDNAEDKRKLRLTHTRTYANGVQLNVLEPVR